MTFPCARKLGNICCGHKMFLKKIRNIFVSRTQNLCPQQMLRARANGETFVPATMCPQQCVLVCQYLKAHQCLLSCQLQFHEAVGGCVQRVQCQCILNIVILNYDFLKDNRNFSKPVISRKNDDKHFVQNLIAKVSRLRKKWLQE